MSRVEVRVWNSDGDRCLVRDGRPASVEVDDGGWAPPERIRAEVRRQLGLHVTLLRVVERDVVEVERDGRGGPPAGWRWHRRQMSPPPERRPPWGRPGWLAGVLAAVDVELARRGMSRRGAPAQIRHSSVTGLLRVPTAGRPVWLKAVPPLFAHEARTIRWLAEVSGQPVPAVLADAGSWWLAEDFPEPDPAPRGDPLVSLARIQLAAAARIDELRVLGCPFRPLAELAGEVRRVVERPDLIGLADREHLLRVLPTLSAVCAEVDALGFPATVAHSDVSPDNTRWTARGWLLYDWTDACVTHPFVDLASPLSYEADEATAAARGRAYASVWAEHLPAAAVARALELSPVVGAAHQVVNYAAIVDAVEPDAGDAASRAQLVIFLRYWMSRLLAALSAPVGLLAHPRPDLVNG